ncbi:MAG TPA: GNAT family N-acetyltransferase [Propionibacteriaceae bacterium]|nr:GNAT family N-acetyltransferase [Propionibacteriaceae bacterium]
MAVQIRALRAGDKVAEGLPSPPPDGDGPRWRRSVVAVAEGQVVGFATLTLNPATDTYFCDVSVSPAHRRRGIGTRLFTEVQQVADRRLPILGRAMSSQPLRRHFAEHLGGSVLMHCPAPAIDPTSTAGRDWTDAQRLPEGYQTTPMADVPAEEIQAAWSAYYTWTHQPFGAIRADALPSVWDDYRAGVDETLSYLCRDADGQIVAFSLVSPEVWDGRTFVIAETVHKDQPHGVSVLQATLAASLRALGQRGIQRVEIEGHSTDAHIPRLFQTLPAGPSDPLDIYRLTPTYDTASSLSA